MRPVLVNVAVFIALVLVLEGVVRMFQPTITTIGTDSRLFADSRFGSTPGPRPLAAGRSNGALFQVDGDGFWAYVAPPDTTRPGWLFLGDSVTMGIGVDPDSTFAGRMAAGLDTARVLNPATVGYTSDDYRQVVRAMVATHPARFNLRRVTVFWCLNDLYDAQPGISTPARSVRDFGGPALAFIRRHYFTYQWLKAIASDRPRSYFDHDSRLYEGDAIHGAIEDLRQVQAVAVAAGLRLDVVLLPYEYQLRRAGDPEVFLPQRLMGERLHAAGLRVYDAAPYLLESGVEPRDLYLYGDGIHFSSLGHRLIAEFLTATLR